jgi:hypothetical protein
MVREWRERERERRGLKESGGDFEMGDGLNG